MCALVPNSSKPEHNDYKVIMRRNNDDDGSFQPPREENKTHYFKERPSGPPYFGGCQPLYARTRGAQSESRLKRSRHMQPCGEACLPLLPWTPQQATPASNPQQATRASNPSSSSLSRPACEEAARPARRAAPAALKPQDLD